MIIVVLAFIATSNVAFARVDSDIVDRGGGKNNRVLSADVVDLQAQIDQMNLKNSQLEGKIFQLENKQPTQVISAPQGSQASPNDAGQTVRIENLEKRVGVIEGLMNGLKTSISKTLDLLTKILSII